MSESQPERTGRGKVSRRTWLIAGGVAMAAGIGIYLWRQRQASTAAAASTTAGTSSTTSADVVDQAGELSVIQSELEALLAQEGSEPATTTGGGTTTPPGGTGILAAPAGISVTPHSKGADLGWGTVPGAAAYELHVQGAGGKGTGTSSYDKVLPGNHAQLSLAPGKYVCRVRAGKSAVDVHGHWTANKDFTVPK